MKADRVVGLIFTVGYTLLVIAGIQADSSGAIQDLVSWVAFLLLIFSYGLFLLPDQQVLELAGGRNEWMVRGLSLGIQVCLLAWSGWWWTVGIRGVTEVISDYRVRMARHRISLGFKVDVDDRGQFFFHCFSCGRSSYNRNDIERLYCGHCKKFHHGHLT